MEAIGRVGDFEMRLQIGSRVSSSSSRFRRSASSRVGVGQCGNGRKTRRFRVGKWTEERRFSLVFRTGKTGRMFGDADIDE